MHERMNAISNELRVVHEEADHRRRQIVNNLIAEEYFDQDSFQPAADFTTDQSVDESAVSPTLQTEEREG